MKNTATICAVVTLLAGVCAADDMNPLRVAGSAAISHEGDHWTVTTTSRRTVIDWSRFDVAEGGSVYFQQPSARSSVLNRVTGASVSHIDGLLSSNGRVYLLNPNGILIGPDGVIRVAQFVGSTLALSDTQFLAGRDMHFTGASEASVINYGRIDAVGGEVYLIGAHVANRGTIAAAGGSANLVAANDVLLTQDHKIFIRPGTGAGVGAGVENGGTIDAAVARLLADGNMYALAINNAGAIRANGVASAGGRVMLVAQGGSIVNTGTVSARTLTGGGEIRIVGADLALHGEINAAGANGGGLVETSAPTMDLAGLTLSTGAGGTWLLDPPVVIDSGLAGAIAGQLTANGNVKYTGESSITVAADIIASPSNADTYLWLGSNTTIALNADIRVGQGQLFLESGSGISQASGKVAQAGRLWVGGAGGADLTIDGPPGPPGQPNVTPRLAVGVDGSGGASVTIRSVNDMRIDTVNGTSGAGVPGGELNLLAGRHVLANGCFLDGIVKEYHALGNVAIVESSPQSGMYEMQISGASPLGRSAAQAAAFAGTTTADLANLGISGTSGSAVRIVFGAVSPGAVLGYSWNYPEVPTDGLASGAYGGFVVVRPQGGAGVTQALSVHAQGDAVANLDTGGAHVYELGLGSLSGEGSASTLPVSARNVFLEGSVPPEPSSVAFVFDRVFDHVEEFPHLRPLARASTTSTDLLGPVLDELNAYFDRATRRTDHRGYYQPAGSVYQVPR
ncbi:MAG: filamentous hemagglutinin N-terminal domain-containing protein [Planctomycetota bacterium]|nr:filamentous hemagglutinin N-terminal domain-containing protein [Planctomycetota bacterium]